MKVKIKLAYLTAMIILASGCSAYSPDDYAEAGSASKESLCVNMDATQEMKCREKEERGVIAEIGADANCDHTYAYERNRCKSEKAMQQQALDESLKKHTGK